jgi:hypothetical protein
MSLFLLMKLASYQNRSKQRLPLSSVQGLKTTSSKQEPALVEQKLGPIASSSVSKATSADL